MQGYCVSYLFHCKPSKITEMKKLIKHVYHSSLQEKGCMEYRWYQSYEKPEDFLLFMTWESKTAFEDHVNSNHVQATHSGTTELPSLENVLQKPYRELTWKFIPVSS